MTAPLHGSGDAAAPTPAYGLLVRGPLAAYVFSVPFGSAVELPVGPPPFNTLSTVLGLLATAGVALHLALFPGRIRPWPGTVVVWLTLTGWLGLTTIWSADPARSFPAFVVLLSLVGLYGLVTLTPVDPRTRRWLELASVAGAGYVAAQAFSLAGAGRLDEGEGRLPRFAVETSDPNITAASLLLPFVLTTWWALHGRSRLHRAAATAAATALLGAVLLTASRGAVIAVLAALLVLLAQASPPARRRMTLLSAALLGAAVLAAATAPPALRTHLLEHDSTGRADIWALGLSQCPERCVTGSGWAAFPAVYQQAYLDEPHREGFGLRPLVAHNIVLSMLVEGGLVGLVLLTLALLLLVSGLRRLPRSLRGPPLAALTAVVVSNLFVSNIGFKYFWVALLYATVVLARDGTQIGRSTPEPAGDPRLLGSTAPARS